MKHIQTVAAALIVGTLLIALPGCDKKGPLEEAGEVVDETIEDAGEAIEDATDGSRPDSE